MVIERETVVSSGWRQASGTGELPEVLEVF